jgi:hypothetical protein
MPRQYPDTTAKYTKVDAAARGSSYAKERQTASKSKFYRSFRSTLLSPHMPTYDSDMYLRVFATYLNVTSGNGETAFEALCSEAFYQGYPAGNLKDVDDTQLANWIDYCKLWAGMIFEIKAQKSYRQFITGCTEDSATGSTSTKPVYWDQSELDIFCNSLLRYPVPKYCVNFVKAAAPFNAIKWSDNYEKFGVNIPESYLLVYTPMRTLAEMEAFRTTMQGLIANSRLHMDKFSIPYSNISDADLEPQPILTDPFSNEDFLAWLNHANFKTYHNAHLSRSPQGDMSSDSGAEYTNRIFWTPDGVLHSKLHRMAPCLAAYDATHNVYGSMFETLSVDTATSGLFAGNKLKRDGTTPAQLTMNEMIDVLINMDAFVSGSATLGLTLDGTNFTAITDVFRDGGISFHPLRYKRRDFYGNGVTKKVAVDWIQKYAVEWLKDNEVM